MENVISHEDSKDANPGSFTTDSENRIWAGSLEKGLLLIEKGKVTRFTYPELKNFTVRKIIKENNNLYLGTLGKGLAVIKPAKVNQLDFEELQGKNIKALIQSKDSSIWVGTRSEGIHRIKSGKITSLSTNEGLLQNGITTVGSSDNKIYAGSTSGITIIDPKTTKVIGKITKEDGLKSNYVYAVYRDSRDWIWILTRYGGMHYLDENRKLNTVKLPEEFANTSFISILELRNKQLVIGSMNKGIFRIKDGVFLENRPLPLTPGEDLVYCIYEDKSGDLWMGTHGGIVLLIGESFKIFNKSNGLKSQSVYSITADGIGGVWISNNFGVQYFSLSELDRFKASTEKEFFSAFTLYNQSTGMPNSEANGLIFHLP